MRRLLVTAIITVVVITSCTTQGQESSLRTPNAAQATKITQSELAMMPTATRTTTSTEPIIKAEYVNATTVSADWVRAKTVLIEDNDGKTKMLLNADKSGSLTFFDNNGMPRILLWLDKDENPNLAFMDRDGKHRANMLIVGDEHRVSVLTIDNINSNAVFIERKEMDNSGIITLTPKGEPVIRLMDKNGKVQGSVYFSQDKNYRLIIADSDNHTVWSAP